MRVGLLVSAFVTAMVLDGAVGAERPEPLVREPVGVSEGLFPYRLDRADARFADLLTLKSGEKHLGKVMEWANQILLFQGDGKPLVYRPAEIEEFEFRRRARHKTIPTLPDMTIAYVERLPRDPSWHGRVVGEDGLPQLDFDPGGTQWHPTLGAKVTFRVHVLNSGGAVSAAVSCRISIDGIAVHSTELPGLEPGQESVLETTWAWQEGPHELRVEIDPEAKQQEAVRWNNTFVEPTQALAVTVVVSKQRYDAFRSTMNLVDSFSFEDWAQYQFRVMNGLFRASAYPSSPKGALERVRCDRIVVVDDPTTPEKRGAWEAALHRDGQPDGLPEYQALLVYDVPPRGHAMAYEALRIDWAALQDLGRQLGLIDPKAADTTIEQCLVLDIRGRYVQRQHLFPHRDTLMYTAGGFPLSEQCVGALNQVLGRPRGFSGDYLYQLPKRTTIEVLSNSGRPLEGLEVEAFQLMSEGEFAGAISGYSKGDPIYSAQTDAQGRLTLLDQETPSHKTLGGFELRPNPFGRIATDGSNGLLLLRLRQARTEEYHFLRLFDCNVAYLRGERDEYVRRIYSRFGDPEAMPPPPYTLVKMDERTGPRPPLQVCWRMPEGKTLLEVEEFRVYRRTGLTGDDARPWVLASTVHKQGGRWSLCADGTYFEEFRDEVPYSLDTFYSVSIVDKEGRESSPSPPGCLIYDKDAISLAMTSDTVYVTLQGDGAAQLACWDAEVGTQHYGIRNRAFQGYAPAFAGVAVDRDQHIVVADPVNHVLAFYDRGDLVKLLPQRPWWPGYPSDEPGEFYEPADVAVDESGRLFVADRLNNRVQVLDSNGQFQGLVDEGLAFEGPHAVGYLNGHLCVTDKAGARCRVYDVRESPAKFVRELPPLIQADRGMVSKTGSVYIAARTSEGSTGLLVFVPRGEGATFDRLEEEDVMGRFFRPRGLSRFPGSSADDWIYCVNEFPFDVHRIKAK